MLDQAVNGRQLWHISCGFMCSCTSGQNVKPVDIVLGALLGALLASAVIVVAVVCFLK